MKKFFKSIEFIIILFFLVRLIGITNPPLETDHNWRQVTGLMVARNFVETNNCIFYPRVDEYNGGSGIIGMEFPAMNYLMYLMSVIFGYTHWYGRLINLIVSSIGVYFFYKIIAEFFNKRHAYYATLILLSSIWFSYSRKTMPDVFCVSLFITGAWFGLSYLRKGNILHLFYYGILACLGFLAKIPAGIYLSIFFIPIFSKQIVLSRKLLWLSPTLIMLFLVYYWYFIWNMHLAATYSSWYNHGNSLERGTGEIMANFGDALERFYFSSFRSYLFFVCFLAGFIMMFIKKEKLLLCIFGLVTATFLIYILKSGSSFTFHSYYIIPYAPTMALVAAYPLTLIRKQWICIIIITAGISEGILNQQHDFFINSSEKYKLSLESIADSISTKKEHILVNGSGNPQQIYLSHRRGWSCNDEQLSNSTYLNKVIKSGCKFIFVDKHSSKIALPLSKVYSDPNYDVYKTN